MSITIVGADIEERIRRQLESGRFADASDVVAHALELLEDQGEIEAFYALIAEADADVAEHGTVPWTPTLFAQILDEAREANRRGDPTAAHVKP